MHEGQAREEMQTGIDAKNLKKNPILILIFENIEKELLDFIRNSDPSDSKGREEAYYQLNAIQAVQLKLQSLINDGKVADRFLQGMRK